MRILLSNNFYYPNMLGGAELSSLTLAELLVERGHDVRMLCLSGHDTTERSTHNGVEVLALGRKLLGTGPTASSRSAVGRLAWHVSAGMDLGWRQALRDAIAEKPVDLVNSFNLAGTTTQLWRAAKDLDLPLVHTLFGTYLVCFRGAMFKNGRDCGTQCTSCAQLTRQRRIDSRLVDAVVGDSQAVLGRHLQHNYFTGTTDHRVINCGFRDATIGGGAAASRPEGPLRIGFLGRLHPTKGLSVLQKACDAMTNGNWELAHWRERVAGTRGPTEGRGRPPYFVPGLAKHPRVS